MEATQRMLRYCRELLRVGGTLRVEYSLLLLKMTAINIFAVHHAADTYAGESTLVSNLALVLSRVVSPRGLTTKQSRLPVTSTAPVQTAVVPHVEPTRTTSWTVKAASSSHECCYFHRKSIHIVCPTLPG